MYAGVAVHCGVWGMRDGFQGFPQACPAHARARRHQPPAACSKSPQACGVRPDRAHGVEPSAGGMMVRERGTV